MQLIRESPVEVHGSEFLGESGSLFQWSPPVEKLTKQMSSSVRSTLFCEPCLGTAQKKVKQIEQVQWLMMVDG